MLNKQITLYPGNVVPISLDVKRVFILLGQLVNSKKEPLPNAKLKRARSLVITDKDGRFQAEVLESKKLIFTYRDVIKPLPAVDLNSKLSTSGSADDDLEPLDLKTINTDVSSLDLQNNITTKTFEKAANNIEEKLATDTDNKNIKPDAVKDYEEPDTLAIVKPKKRHKKSEHNKPANPDKIVLENTPQWVKDAENGVIKLGKKRTCSVTLPKTTERHGVIIYKKPLVCIEQ